MSARSEGIPLFVGELLGAVRDGGIDHDYLPPSLRDVLLARAERLSDVSQHVLRVASAAARWVPERLLGAVAGLEEGELYPALREAVAHQLLVVDSSGRGYRFRHALARAAVHDDLLPGERTRRAAAGARWRSRCTIALLVLGAAALLGRRRFAVAPAGETQIVAS